MQYQQNHHQQNQPDHQQHEYNCLFLKVTTASGVSSLSLALPPASLLLSDQFAMTSANLSAHAQYEVRLKSSICSSDLHCLFPGCVQGWRGKTEASLHLDPGWETTDWD